MINSKMGKGMDNKILLCTTGNYVQYPVTNRLGKEYEKDFIHTHTHTHTCVCVCVCVCARSCPTLWDPMDYSLLAPLSKKIFQARILQWVAIFYSSVSSQPRVRTHFCISCIGDR